LLLLLCCCWHFLFAVLVFLLFVALFVPLLVTYSLYHSLWFCGFLIKVIAIQKKNSRILMILVMMIYRLDFKLYSKIEVNKVKMWIVQSLTNLSINWCGDCTVLQLFSTNSIMSVLTCIKRNKEVSVCLGARLHLQTYCDL
jgi:hypothetical protein